MLFEFRGDKTLRVNKRLFAYVISRNLFQFAVADLDVVAKDLVKAHLKQLTDTSPFTLMRL